MQGVGLPNPMFFIGSVEDVEDPRGEGRVRVRAFGVHGTNQQIESEDLPWAICIAGNYDPNYAVPPLNSWVFGMFVDGREAQHPMILGLIPMQYVEACYPTKDGHGVVGINGIDDPLARLFGPQSFGMPTNSKLARAEDLDETYLFDQELNRKTKQKIADTEQSWSEPSSAYAAKYPYNRVIETGAHSIELDDTPGSERIMIHHKNGSYIQIDSVGSVTERAQGDRYEINIGTKHESSGHSVVTINGNAHVYVKGDKTEEIDGNYKLLVHGDALIGTGRSLNLNAGGLLQGRGATVKMEALTDVMTLFGKQEIQFEAENQLNFVSQNIKNTALLNYDIYCNKSIKLTSVLDIHATASNIIMNAPGLIPPNQLSGGTGVPGFSINTIAMQVTAATGSITGIWNAATINAGAVLTGALSAEGALIDVLDVDAINARAVNTSILAAPLPISSAPGSPCAPGPGRLVGITAPTIEFAFVPAIVPAAVSNPLPIPAPGFTSGWAYPTGNTDEFFAKVLTSPFSLIGSFDPIPPGGWGMKRIQMPEPPSEKCTIVPNGYFSVGFSSGFMAADDNADQPASIFEGL